MTYTESTLKELEALLQTREYLLADLKSDAKEIEKEIVKRNREEKAKVGPPKIGSHYWIIVISRINDFPFPDTKRPDKRTWEGDFDDRHFFECGNFYLSKKDAQEAIDRESKNWFRG